MSLHLKTKEAAKYVLWNKKNKSFWGYAIMCVDMGGVQMINIPNKTRVSDALILIQDSLC